MANHNQNERRDDDYGEPIHSQAIKAGRRTYFVDVRSTRDNDYFLTITESRKRLSADGVASYDRHKIFLYKEDFDKVRGGIEEAINFIKEHKPEHFTVEKEDHDTE